MKKIFIFTFILMFPNFTYSKPLELTNKQAYCVGFRANIDDSGNFIWLDYPLKYKDLYIYKVTILYLLRDELVFHTEYNINATNQENSLTFNLYQANKAGDIAIITHYQSSNNANADYEGLLINSLKKFAYSKHLTCS